MFVSYRELNRLGVMLKEQTVWQYIDLRIAVLKSEDRKETAKNYGTTRNSLRRFCTNESLHFTDIDENFVNAYNSYLAREGMQMSTVSFYNRTFRSIYNQAVRDGLVKNTHPFDEVYTKVVVNTQPRTYAIEDCDSRVLLNDLPREELLNRYRTLQTRYNNLVKQLTGLVSINNC